MARDKNGCEFEEGQRVKFAVGDASYEGSVIGLHEDGAHVATDDGTRYTPAAKDCEVLPPQQGHPEPAAVGKKKSGKGSD